MITKANIEILAKTDGVDWITALKAPTIKKLARTARSSHPCLTSRTSRRSPTSASSPRAADRVPQPVVGAQRARKREELLTATETDLAQIAHRVEHGTLLGADLIGLAVEPALKRHRVKKHFQITITDTTFTYTRDTPSPRKPRSTVSTSCGPASPIPTSRTGISCAPTRTSTGRKSVRVTERPRTADPPDPPPPRGPRPRARADLHARLLPHLAPQSRVETPAVHRRAPPVNPDPVAKAVRSPAAQQKAQTKPTTTSSPRTATERSSPSSDPDPNTTRLHGSSSTFEKLTQPTALQAHALELAANAPVVVAR